MSPLGRQVLEARGGRVRSFPLKALEKVKPGVIELIGFLTLRTPHTLT